MLRKKGVEIIECLDKDDHGSEGYFIRNMLRLMRIEKGFSQVKTRIEMVEKIRRSEFEFIHLTTHGRESRDETFGGICAEDGDLDISHFASLKNGLGKCTFLSTACFSFHDEFSRQFVNLTRCVNYIAPREDVKFTNSIFFAHIFYHKIFVVGKSVKEAMDDYKKVYKNPDRFELLRLKTLLTKKLG